MYEIIIITTATHMGHGTQHPTGLSPLNSNTHKHAQRRNVRIQSIKTNGATYLFLSSLSSLFLVASSERWAALGMALLPAAMTTVCGNEVGVLIWYAWTEPAETQTERRRVDNKITEQHGGEVCKLLVSVQWLRCRWRRWTLNLVLFCWSLV